MPTCHNCPTPPIPGTPYNLSQCSKCSLSLDSNEQRTHRVGQVQYIPEHMDNPSASTWKTDPFYEKWLEESTELTNGAVILWYYLRMDKEARRAYRMGCVAPPPLSIFLPYFTTELSLQHEDMLSYMAQAYKGWHEVSCSEYAAVIGVSKQRVHKLKKQIAQAWVQLKPLLTPGN